MKTIAEDKHFSDMIASLVEATGMPANDIRSEALKYLKELSTGQKPFSTMAAMEGARYILSRGYDKNIDTNAEELRSVSNYMLKHPVAFVMTHKTYIDMFVLGLVLMRHGLPLPHIFAGINMDFMGLGQLARQTGTIFIRRSIKDNLVYKATLRYYIASIVKRNGHFMWALEGTRSRTGKLVWPKMGILKYIVEAEKYSKKDVKYIPVSVVYDLIPDVQVMTQEGRGMEKNPENLVWFLNYIRKMGSKLGKISLRFGEPVAMRAASNVALPLPSQNGQEFLPKFAFDLAYNINESTPVTTSSLICNILLSKFAHTKEGLEHDVVSLMRLIESHKEDALVDRGTALGESVQNGINILINGNIIKKLGTGNSTKYSIVTDNYLSATYYANMAVHHLYRRAFIELALVKIKSSKSANRSHIFWEEIMALRDLFKFEFFYSTKAIFTEEVEEELQYLKPDWEEALNEPKFNVANHLKKLNVLVSQVVLKTYIEAYKVVAQALLNLGNEETFHEDDLLANCIFLGEEMHWQGRIHRVESVSKPFLTNGIRLAKNFDLFPKAGNRKKKQIRSFIKYLDELSDRLHFLQRLTIEKNETPSVPVPIERNIVPGSKTAGLTAVIMDGPEGPEIGALFDLDRTLIRGFSAKNFYRERVLSGKMKPQEIIAQFSGLMTYATGTRNFSGLAAVGAQGVKGIKEKVFIDTGEDIYLKELAAQIYPESRALVAAHMAKGHTVAIVSAATPYQVNPIAADLGIKHILCTRLEVENGVFTGNIDGYTCWGDGKSKKAKELADKVGFDLSKSYFYTDSVEDLPLLEIVKHPRPLNPDKELSALAFKKNWPVNRFSEEKRVSTVNQLVRTGLTVASLVPAVFNGVAKGTTTGSWKEGINSMMSSIGDIGTKMAGITMAVKGKENLWSHRPAVFLFNHQSSADFFIVSKLLRKDAVAIAKKELQRSPLGPLLKLAGVVFIDRKNREKAIEAMKPAIDALQNGTSVAIAPEGTRSKDYQLGKFKKGAFHLAMQAGVPVVPIVILNAHDVMPKGSFVVNPTVVEVEVLKPISVAKWNKENLDNNIAKVRKLYLKTLDQV